jgi:hypothetical protein
MAENRTPPQGEIFFYSGPSGKVRVEVLFEDETFWLSQRRMAELFGVDVRTINEHLQNIYETNELDRLATIRKFRIVQQEGGRDVARDIDYHNLDAIIAVGYRVNSREATQFRIWATQTLREYIIKGFALDDERLKQGKKFGRDYFDELLERIREIRASERRFYLKITDIYEQCSIDYNKNSDLTEVFFKTVQNKMHWAITGQTAAEIIKARADASKPNMGLTTWKNSPEGKVLKSDVTIAKNYLTEGEMKELERVVSIYLDFAENQAQRQIPMRMADWVSKLDGFLKLNDYDILNHPGKVSAALAKEIAEGHYETFRIEQDRSFESDFEREAKRIAPASKPGKGGKP